MEYGIKAFEKLFGMGHQFSKYDTMFAPHLSFAFGALECPGNFIFDDIFIESNSQLKTWLQAFVGWHEMAHMWYGNCVGIEWWGHTYLKENFADYSAQLVYDQWYNSDKAHAKIALSPDLTFAFKKANGMLLDMSPTHTRGCQFEVELA